MQHNVKVIVNGLTVVNANGPTKAIARDRAISRLNSISMDEELYDINPVKQMNHLLDAIDKHGMSDAWRKLKELENGATVGSYTQFEDIVKVEYSNGYHYFKKNLVQQWIECTAKHAMEIIAEHFKVHGTIPLTMATGIGKTGTPVPDINPVKQMNHLLDAMVDKQMRDNNDDPSLMENQMYQPDKNDIMYDAARLAAISKLIDLENTAITSLNGVATNTQIGIRIRRDGGKLRYAHYRQGAAGEYPYWVRITREEIVDIIQKHGE